jgi:DNA-binding LacI/PurR family transcriptional regulator
MSRVTIGDVARAANCSIATVSLVINGRGRVAEETRCRVLKIQSDLGYTPNPAGRNLRTQKTNTLGLLFYPSCAKLFRNVFYAEIMEGLEESLSAIGYDLLLAGGDFSGASQRLPAFLQQRRVDAAVLLGAFPHDLVEKLTSFQTPLLMLDGNYEDLSVDSITTDGFSAGKMIVDHLYELGHRRIIMMAYDMEDYNIDVRIRGFAAGLRAHGLPVEGAIVRNFISHLDALATLKELLKTKDRPTALVCVNDNLAVTLGSHLQEVGFSIPADLSLVGFDDDVFGREYSPRLTTIGVDKAGLGKAGAQLLFERLKNPSAPISKLRVPVQLICRESVADLRGKTK